MNLPEDRFEELEAKLIEQEHLPIQVITNFYRRKEWPEGDPRRLAADSYV